MKMAFIFGKNWRLSLAEILAFFESKKVDWQFLDLSIDALVVDAEIDAEKTIQELGGTLKIVSVSNEFDFADISKQDFGDEKEVALSFYGKPQLLRDVRKIFRHTPPRGTYSHTELFRKRIDENALIFSMKTCYFGRTVAVSNPFEFKTRDDGRPFQRPELSISPSRARILVNLSQAKQDVLDPFCGIGTVGQEAMLAGIGKVMLSDIDSSCVEKTRKNCEWTKKKFKTTSKVLLQACDARRMEEKWKRISAIATEPDLGPMLQKPVSNTDARKIISYLSGLYRSFFASAERVLDSHGRIAIIFPAIQARNRKIFVEKRYPGFRFLDLFSNIPEPYKTDFFLKPFVVDEEREPGKKRIVAREFCVYAKEGLPSKS